MKSILFVEDDAVVARIYSQKLSEAGFEVAVAEDGLVAVKKLSERNPDLVVLDLIMPRFTGVDVLKFIRRHAQLKETRVIVFSNSFLNKLGEEVQGLGVQEMLLKSSANPALLLELIARVLKSPADLPNDSAQPSPGAPAPAAGSNAHPSALQKPSAPLPGVDFTGESGAGRAESALSFRIRLRRDFFAQIPAICKSVRQLADEFLQSESGNDRVMRLENLGRKIRFVAHMTGMAGCYRINQLANALEALIFELQEKPASITESVKRTVDTTIALLIDWLSRADQPDEQCLSPTTILVVDDDGVSNRALVFALSRANLTARCVTHPLQAIEKLQNNSFDVILLDINLPGMSGLSLCEQIRRMPQHKNTPIIFMTIHSEFEARARELLRTGDDFIAKPILPIELTVKVTAHMLKRRLGDQQPVK